MVLVATSGAYIEADCCNDDDDHDDYDEEYGKDVVTTSTVGM